MSAALQAHLEGGATTVCRAFAVARRDGVVLGFTDHDRDLAFEGILFRADTGLTARALSQSTGLAVDNSEALGALSSDAITEADILAGRYDGAELRSWLVNWQEPEERLLQFRGSLGEITRSGGAFTAELRGLTERLNQPVGRIYHARCSAVLGDGSCRFDTATPGFAAEGSVAAVEGAGLELTLPAGFAEGWFDRGRLEVLGGAAAGLGGVVRADRVLAEGRRRVELWQALGAAVAAGDPVRLVAGCDRRAGTCREKFGNFLNFRGFPDIPGEDWLMSYPARSGKNTGGSRRE